MLEEVGPASPSEEKAHGKLVVLVHESGVAAQAVLLLEQAGEVILGSFEQEGVFA